MKRALLLIELALLWVELGADALLLAAFRCLQESSLLAFAPVIGVSALYALVLLQRWARGLDGERGREEAREAVALLPRRLMLNRSLLLGGASLFTAVGLSIGVGARPGTAGMVFGTLACVGFAVNAGRSWASRRLLDPLGQSLFAEDPLRYVARCLRERLFVATGLVGAAGVAVACFYLRFVVGVPTGDFAAVMGFAPAVIAATLGMASVDLWLFTAPLLPFLSRRGDPPPPVVVLRAAGSAPFRFATWALAAWIFGGLLAALVHMGRTSLDLQVLQVFAGVVASGLGLLPFEVSWHRRILAPVREAAAAAVANAGLPPESSRLSVRTQVIIAFVAIIGFVGVFALLTSLSAHERLLSTSSALAACERRDALMARQGEALRAAANDPAHLLEMAQALSTWPGELVVVQDGTVAGRPEIALSPSLLGALRASEPAVEALSSPRVSLALVPLSPTAALGVMIPWRDFGRSDALPLLFVVAALGLASVGLVLVFIQELARPLRRLVGQAHRMGQANLGERLLRLHLRCGLRARSSSFRGLCYGFAVAVTRLPSSGVSAPVSYRGVSTELLGRDFHPLVKCTFTAHRALALATGAARDSSTPFGRPEVPDVNTIAATLASSGTGEESHAGRQTGAWPSRSFGGGSSIEGVRHEREMLGSLRWREPQVPDGFEGSGSPRWDPDRSPDFKESTRWGVCSSSPSHGPRLSLVNRVIPWGG